MRDFALEKTLGTGGFAVVKLATHRRTGRRYAVKIMNVTANVGGDKDAGGKGGSGSGGDAMSLEEIARRFATTISVNKAKNAVKVYDFTRRATTCTWSWNFSRAATCSTC